MIKPYIITSIAALVIVNYINVDVIIARKNVDRYFKTGKVDLDYLSYLSCDAAPEIARLLDSQDRNIAQGAKELLYNEKVRLSQKKPWPSFNIAKFRAYNYLSGLDLTPASEEDF